MKKIPYGISDFRKLIEQNYLYIDKTKYLEILENIDEKFLFFLRPRRFGKSLFVSLLNYYYDVKYKDEFDNLFKDLYIGKNPTPFKNSYYILRFNFSGINTDNAESTLIGFRKNILNGLKTFLETYNLKFVINENDMPSEIFNDFLRKVEQKFKNDKKIYCLIDEYDHFANELLGFNYNTFTTTVSQTGFVRKWYEVLKIGTETGLIDRLFVTGVSPITLDSMTSGFNIGSNETRAPILNEMMGFTQEEVSNLLKQYLPNTTKLNETMQILKKYYNGYLFSEESDLRVYNSDMTLYYISLYNRYKKPPKNLIDSNIASDYKKMQKLFSIKEKEQNFKILNSIMKGEEQSVILTRQFSLEKDFTSDDFKSLLFYMGFLTIKKEEMGLVYLTVPNYVIKELYFDFFYKIIKDESNYRIESSDLLIALREFAINGDITPFIAIVQTVLKKLSNRDYIKFDEKYIKVIILTYLMQSKLYYVKSEYEVDNGYIDIVLFKAPGIDPKYQAIFELKYIKKNDFTKKILESKIDEATEQILKYKTSEELTMISNLKKYIIIIVGDEIKTVKEVL